MVKKNDQKMGGKIAEDKREPTIYTILIVALAIHRRSITQPEGGDSTHA